MTTENNETWVAPGTPVCIDIALSVGTGVRVDEDGVGDDSPRFWAIKAFLSDKRVGTLVLSDFAIQKLYMALNNEFKED